MSLPVTDPVTPASIVFSPRRMLSQARWTATSDDEHAVSIASAGPLRLST